MRQSLKRWIVVIDFESNCSGDQIKDHEICEFPAVLVDLYDGNTANAAHTKHDEFHCFVRGVKFTALSPFIKKLTHITDHQVFGPDARTWQQAMDDFEAWCVDRQLSSANCTVVTCGNWDLKTMLARQLLITNTQLSPLLNELFGCWNNIKIAYAKCISKRLDQCTKPVGMAQMLANLKLPLEGHHHSGIDDSRNIARIALTLRTFGWDVSLPNRLRETPLHYQIADDLPYRRTKRGAIIKKP